MLTVCSVFPCCLYNKFSMSSNSKQEIERKTKKFQAHDREDKTKKRGQVQVRKCIKLALAHAELNEAALEFTWMRKKM